MLSSLATFVLVLIQPPHDAKPEMGLGFPTKYPDARYQASFYLTDDQIKDMDREWGEALSSAPIKDTIVIGHHGLAKKYVFLLEGDYMAMAKPVQRDLWFYSPSVFPTIDWLDLYRKRRHSVRMDREYQGWGELAGYALDRVLGFNTKPTIVGRYIDSKTLYAHDYSILGRILYAMPSRPVPVSMHAWVTGLSTRPPSTTTGKVLTFQLPMEKDVVGVQKLKEFSNVLVFDFLLDDHDRLGNHNWKSSTDGKILVWDSGLALNFGPYNSDLEILCGTHQWNGDPTDTPHNVKRPDCSKICKFSNETISFLRKAGPYVSDSEQLGNLVRRKMLEDELFPIFEFGLFSTKRSGLLKYWNQVNRFKAQNFFDGITRRTGYLLNHVDHCINIHGEENVLLV